MEALLYLTAVVTLGALLAWLADPSRGQNRRARQARAAMLHEVPAEQPCANCGSEVILVNQGNAEAFAANGELPESYDYRCARCSLTGHRFIV